MTAKSSKHSRRTKKVQTPAATKESKPWIQERHYRLLHIAVFVISFILCGIISIKLGPDNNWDLRNYHYYNPFAYLTGRIGFDFAPAQMQCYLNPVMDFLHYFGITYLPPKLYGFLMGGIHGLNIGLVFSIVFALFKRFSPNLRIGLSLLCAAMGGYSPIFIGEIGATQNDILISIFSLLSIYLFVKVLVDHDTLAAAEARNKVILASLIFGIGVGLKLTLMSYAIGCAIAFLITETTWKNRATVLTIWCFAFVAGFLISNGFWMIKMYNQFGNPTFPFYNNIFESPWAELHTHSDDRWLAHSLGEALFRPIEIAYDNYYSQTQNLARDARYAIIYILSIIAILSWFVRRYLLADDEKRQQAAKPKIAFSLLTRAEFFLLIYFVASYIVWQVKFAAIRYTSPIEQLGPVIIVSLVFVLFRSNMVRLTTISVAFVAIVVMLNPVQHLRAVWHDEFWNVELPTIPDPDNTIIILANTRPWGYFVPLFPHEIRWVRVKSNFTDPAHNTKMQSEIRKVLAEHDGDVFLLTRSHKNYYAWIEHDIQVLAEYGLTLDTTRAMPIRSEYSRPGLYLVPVIKRTEDVSRSNN